MPGTSTAPQPETASRTDWGHVAMVLAIALLSAWYLFDAARASASVDNLLLIAPAAVLAMLLALGIAVGEIRRGRATAPVEAGLAAPVRSTAATRRTLVFMLLMALYVAGLTWGPFDLATAVFTFASLYALGERRWWFLIVFSVVATVILLACLSALMPSSLPLLLPL